MIRVRYLDLVLNPLLSVGQILWLAHQATLDQFVVFFGLWLLHLLGLLFLMHNKPDIRVKTRRVKRGRDEYFSFLLRS